MEVFFFQIRWNRVRKCHKTYNNCHNCIHPIFFLSTYCSKYLFTSPLLHSYCNSDLILFCKQFKEKFGVRSIRNNHDELIAVVYLQVSIVSQALIFVTRSRMPEDRADLRHLNVRNKNNQQGPTASYLRWA